MNLRERFPEEELTLGKNRFLEVASLVECDFLHFPFLGFPNKIQGIPGWYQYVTNLKILYKIFHFVLRKQKFV